MKYSLVFTEMAFITASSFIRQVVTASEAADDTNCCL